MNTPSSESPSRLLWPTTPSTGQACFRSCWAGSFCGSHLCCCSRQPSCHLEERLPWCAMERQSVPLWCLPAVRVMVSAQRPPGLVCVCPSVTEHSPLAPQWPLQTVSQVPEATEWPGSSGRAVLELVWLTLLLSPFSLQGCIITSSSQGPQKWVCLPPILSIPTLWELLRLCTWHCPFSRPAFCQGPTPGPLGSMFSGPFRSPPPS